MSNYSKTVNFAIKDALTTGDASKRALGTELDTELTNIATAVATKADTTAVAAYSTGSFTMTLVGCSTSPTASATYYKVGDVVSLTLTASLGGPSNANTMSVSGLPAAIRPVSSSIHWIPCILLDSAGGAIGLGLVNTNGTITFYYPSAGTFSASGFTASGSKGLQLGFEITYNLA